MIVHFPQRIANAPKLQNCRRICRLGCRRYEKTLEYTKRYNKKNTCDKTKTMMKRIETYLTSEQMSPLFLCGDALDVLRKLPSNSIDMALTSPPYWGKREYDSPLGIGLEETYETYIENLLAVFGELHRVIKPAGSFWLNIGDGYKNKKLLGIPWRIAIQMSDTQGWILRNNIIWNKVKGSPDNSTDKLRNMYENIFHFVKTKKYYYNVDVVRRTPHKSKIENGAVISATEVTGIRYKRQIELSTALTVQQKKNAFDELNMVLEQVKSGKVADFRMIIKGQQRTTHSDSINVSGRAKELENKGYYFLKCHPNGAKIGDIWDIIPEDTQGRKTHFAPYPADLCRIPILTTCPEGGVVLDFFCGTGTTMLVALEQGRKSIGIDISNQYLDHAKERIEQYQLRYRGGVNLGGLGSLL